MYAHLFLLADGRVFYSGGQYGDNNGVKPAIWDLGDATPRPTSSGCRTPGMRNQSASVLLPPAQDQRVMIIGGGPYDMHNQAGATGSTAIADLSAAGADLYPRRAPATWPRMHLCATLLPDRAVLVNGGAMMEESAADAGLRRRDLPPGAAGTWRMAATSRVPRLYHSVALLMPDGKVVTAGSNPQRKTEELRIEVFWPPYLFVGARPSCTPGAGGGALRRGPDRRRPGRRTTCPRRASSAPVPPPTPRTPSSAWSTCPTRSSRPGPVRLQLPGNAAIWRRPAGTCCSSSIPPGCRPTAPGST